MKFQLDIHAVSDHHVGPEMSQVSNQPLSIPRKGDWVIDDSGLGWIVRDVRWTYETNVTRVVVVVEQGEPGPSRLRKW